MPLPPDIVQRYRHEIDGMLVRVKQSKDDAEYYSLRFQCISLVRVLAGKGSQYESLIEDLMSRNSSEWPVLHGFIDALKRDFEAGRFDNLPERLAANIASEYLRQAEDLLREDRLGTNARVLAAVLAGAVLENGLRHICQRQNPAIEILQTNGKSKMLGELIADLDKTNGISKPTEKLLVAWKEIRNAAAHGQFDQFTREQVEMMIAGVKQFLADYG